MRLYWSYDSVVDAGRISIADKSIRGTVTASLRQYSQVLVFLTVVLWLVLSLFFGTNYKRNELGYCLHIDLVDLDGGPTGQAISEYIMSIPHSDETPTWRLNGNIFNMEQARAYVKNDAWGMLVINRGLSAGLSAALSSGAVYNASAALTLLEQSGHHPIAQLMFIQPTLVQVAGAVASAMAVKQLAAYQSSGNITSRTSTNLHALLNPVGWTVENLGLFDFQLSTLVMPMAMLISFICVLVPLMMLKFGSYAAYKTTKHQHIYIALVFVALILCLVYSLFGTLAFLAFKGPDYGPKHQGLPITSGLVFSLWMCFFITLFPMALWLKALVTLVPPAFVAVPSVLTIIPSMCAGMTVVDLSPKFFRWMQALPFYQGGMLARYIVSGAHRRLGANLGILLGETAFSAALLYVATRINQHNVFTGAVDRMGNYRGTLGYTGSALVEPKAATLPTEPQVSSQSLESGIRQNAHAPSTTMSIVDDNDNVDAAMRNETLAI